ncbi:MAG: hypothetical protein K1X95_12500 [Acidimicrobiia bacterium]|nr:hypothetical protein [Acidimicrobiia bacterium]
MGTPSGRPALGYSAHATAQLAAFATARGRRVPRDGAPDRSEESGAWNALGLLVGSVIVAAICLVAVGTNAQTTPTGGLLTAVPSDAAFGTAVRNALDDMHPYESASQAADLPDPDSWADEFVSMAVQPSLARLTATTPPAHLRAPTKAAVSALERVEDELGGYRICRAKGGDCSTQRRGFDHAIDEAYRLLGDLSLYTFG